MSPRPRIEMIFVPVDQLSPMTEGMSSFNRPVEVDKTVSVVGIGWGTDCGTCFEARISGEDGGFGYHGGCHIGFGKVVGRLDAVRGFESLESTGFSKLVSLFGAGVVELGIADILETYIAHCS